MRMLGLDRACKNSRYTWIGSVTIFEAPDGPMMRVMGR
jgi:hypothetical protein